VYNLFLILLFPFLLFGDVDSDFDGVEDSVDRCLQTPFDKTVDRYGCPEDERYFGRVNLELLYTHLLEDQEERGSFYLDYNYNNFLLSLSSAYAQDYTYQDSVLVGYRVDFSNSTVKVYGGVEENELLLSGSYEYLWKNYIGIVSLSYYDEVDPYMSYMFGLGIGFEKLNIYLYYMSSGSTTNFSDEYKSIESVVSYTIGRDFYLKSGINYSLVDQRLYDIYLAIGVSFE